MKGQSSVEFVAIIGMALILATPLVVEGQDSMIDLVTSSEDAQFQGSINKLGSVAQQVSASGPKTSRTVDLRTPSNIVNVYVQDQALIYEMNRGGDLQNFSQSFPRKINFDNTNINQGLTTLDITSKSGELNIRPKGESKNTVVSSQSGWNKGSFNGASVDRNDNSGNLGLGYRNGGSGDNLIGYWRMDRESGEVVDYSGEGNDGTTVNFDEDERGNQGVFGTKAFEFDGGSDKIAVSDDESLDGGNSASIDELTISTWLYHDSVSGDRDIMVKGIHQSNEPLVFWGDGGKSAYAFLITDDAGDYSNVFYSDFTTVQDEWTHVAVTFEGNNNFRMYINGEEDSNSPYDVSDVDELANTQDNLYIGGDRNGNKWFDGMIDETKFYDRALSSSEIQDLYFDGRPFKGNYSMEVNNSMRHDWTSLEVDADVPSGTNLSAQFEVLDSSGGVLENQVIDVDSNIVEYDLDVQDSEDARVNFNGTSSNSIESWSVSEFTVNSR